VRGSNGCWVPCKPSVVSCGSSCTAHVESEKPHSGRGSLRERDRLRCAAVKVEDKKVIAIEYTLTDDAGQVLDTSEGREPLTYLHGSGNIVPGLENALTGIEVGQTIEVDVTPEQGYGVYDQAMVQKVPVRKLPDKGQATAGAVLRVQTPQGQRLVTVKAVERDYATIDFNHPLAGKTLHFKVKVVSVREPTEEETAHGHAHGAGGGHGH